MMKFGVIVFGKVGGLGGVSVMSDATLEFSDGYLCGNWDSVSCYGYE